MDLRAINPRDVTLIMPASGLSRRFGEPDKLTAMLSGRAVAAYAARRAASLNFARLIAVVPSIRGALADIFFNAGFELTVNEHAHRGQLSSLACAAAYIDAKNYQPANLCIMLADMPLIPRFHIEKLLANAGPRVTKTRYKTHSQPPVIFRGKAARRWIDAVQSGGKNPAAANAEDDQYVDLADPFGDDIDTVDDLMRIQAYLRLKPMGD